MKLKLAASSFVAAVAVVAALTVGVVKLVSGPFRW